MRIARIAAVAAVLAALVVGVAVQAAPGRNGQTEQNGPLGLRGLVRDTVQQVVARLRQIPGDLSLTPDQKQSIARILQDHRDEIVKVVNEVHAGRDAVKKVVRADNVDERAIRRAVRDLNDALGDAAVLRAKIRHEVRGVLTPEQRKAADAAASDIDRIVDDAIAQIGK